MADPLSSLATRPGVAQCLDMYAKLASGVCVVTTRGPDGRSVGATVSSAAAVSAAPALMSLCLANASRTLAALRHHGAFALHVLDERHRPWAERCADPLATAAERFGEEHAENSEYAEYVHDVPVRTDVLAWSVCAVTDIRPYGDHHLIVGEVLAAHTGAGQPLLWYDRGFHGRGGVRHG
ncbi:flavin reductase family protein [Streptomyces geranii]|uniref:flavin reductase family protein n=1 Tax=Streptomyces geranii TaxID=2058923 RepID=UPI000D031BF9|nr:flavin reductase family protein [Streptomyces geranii]